MVVLFEAAVDVVVIGRLWLYWGGCGGDRLLVVVSGGEAVGMLQEINFGGDQISVWYVYL